MFSTNYKSWDDVICIVFRNTFLVVPNTTDYSQKTNVNTDKVISWLVSSVEQSGTPFIPKFEICEEIDFNKFNHGLDICGKNINDNQSFQNIAIGPEGGWSQDELNKFSYTSSINEFTFRTETAAIVAVSLMI